MRSGLQYVLRLGLNRDTVSFGQLVKVVDHIGADIVALDLVRTEEEHTVRDLTVELPTERHLEALEAGLKEIAGVTIQNVSDRTFLMHLGGKLEIAAKVQVKTRTDLAQIYTPGVARVVQAIAADPNKAFQLTMKRNMVAIVTDGSAILGLGNLGAKAALPVMEGKSVLFKQLAGVDAFPICLDTQDSDEIVDTVRRLAPGFGGINLEDIAAPRCFEIERRLSETLDIPVFHDDQHGTAVVILAGLINAAKVVGKSLPDLRVVVAGVGAAGTAATDLLLYHGIRNIIGYDREGALVRGRRYRDRPNWEAYAEKTNPDNVSGSLRRLLQGADVFIGVSSGNLLQGDDLAVMAPGAIAFLMANPIPEISPEEAERHVQVVATGRSDYPNQINNVLCFPGLFRGVLNCRARSITMGMKAAAAEALASVVRSEELGPEYIIPGVFNRQVVDTVASAVAHAAEMDGVARRNPPTVV